MSTNEIIDRFKKSLVLWNSFNEEIELKDLPQKYKGMLIEIEDSIESIKKNFEDVFPKYEAILTKEEINMLNEYVENVNIAIRKYESSKIPTDIIEITDNIMRLSQELSNFDIKAANRTDRIINRFQDKMQEFEEEFKELKDNEIESFSELRQQIKNEGRTEVTELRELKGEFQGILEKITDSLLEDKYEKAAKWDMGQRILWQFLALIGIGGMIYFTINAFNETLVEEINLYSIVGKVISVGTLGTFATYAAKQAKLFDESFNRNKKMALRLATLNPFLAGFKDTKKQQIKERLVYELFADEVEFTEIDNKNLDETIQRNSELKSI
ncbi:hypothetical protein [Sutcliffiella cohnii]|uniref:hypothetical protein n=1 Tax=Sutcliffiella cohnii TaxID=33932 RepID=UPI002E1D1796|nr:hypothetical protein [Sutcliffiella cohnii]